MDHSIIFSFLANTPGNLVYHLVVSLALALTGGLALVNAGKQSEISPAWNIISGCSILLFFQILIFSLNFVNLNTAFFITAFSPVIERLASVLTLLWLTWMLIETNQRFLMTGLSILLTTLLILAASASMVLIHLPEFLPWFSSQTINLLWQSVALVLILMGILLLSIKKPQQAWVGIAILILLAAGHTLELMLENGMTGSMGAVRLSQTISLPWVLTLTQRFTRPASRSSTTDKVPLTERTRSLYELKAGLIGLLLKISLMEEPEEKYRAIARALSLGVVADICYIVHVSEENHNIELSAGYDLIREVFLEPVQLNRDDLLHTMDAWEEQRVFRLSDDETDTRDSYTLAMILKYHRISHLLAYPLETAEQPLAGGILFLSPYTSKLFGEEAIHLLEKTKDTLGEILFAPNPIQALRTEFDQAKSKISNLIDENQVLMDELAEKNLLINHQITSIQQLKARYQIEKLETIKKIEQLQTEIRQSPSPVSLEKDYSEKLEQMYKEIRQLTKERDQVKTLLSRANNRIKDLESQTGQTGPIRLSMETQIISLDSIAANLQLQIAADLQRRNVDLKIINPDGRQMIKTDPELLQSALVGLLNNALLATDHRSSVKVNLELSFETGMLIVEVTDYGSGLSQEEQTALFNAKQEILPGIGSIQSIREAIRAIRVLNGKIWLRSKKGAFTTFRVQLPVRIID